MARDDHVRIPRPATALPPLEKRGKGRAREAWGARELAAAGDRLHGLSPDQLHALLYAPLDSPWLIDFPDPLDVEPAAEVVTLFRLMVEALGERGVKATATGNLPRQLCREAARRYWGDLLYEERTEIKGIYQELDFFEFHTVHVLAEIAGLIRKYRGRLILSRDCRRRLEESGLAGVYSRLLLAGASGIDWSYRDPRDELPWIQQVAYFTLYLLARYGDRSLPSAFYEDCFLRLCPMELHGDVRADFLSPEETVRAAYTWQSFKDFAEPLGLVSLKPIVDGRSRRAKFEIRKTPLLDHAVHFRVPS